MTIYFLLGLATRPRRTLLGWLRLPTTTVTGSVLILVVLFLFLFFLIVTAEYVCDLLFHSFDRAFGLVPGTPLSNVLHQLRNALRFCLCQVEPVHRLGETQVGVHAGNGLIRAGSDLLHTHDIFFAFRSASPFEDSAMIFTIAAARLGSGWLLLW